MTDAEKGKLAARVARQIVDEVPRLRSKLKPILVRFIEKEACKKWQSTYEGWFSGSGSKEEVVIRWVIYSDGSYEKVPYGKYSEGSGSGYSEEWEKDVYVGDYLNDEAIAIFSASYGWSNYCDCNYTNLTLYLFGEDTPEMHKEILNGIKAILKKLPKSRLYSIYARVK